MFSLRQTQAFQDWFTELRDANAKRRIAQRLVRLQAGLFGDVKPVGQGVSELRVDYGPGYRVYFVQRGATLIVLLCGGDKRTRRATSKPRRPCRATWRTYEDHGLRSG